MKLATRLKPAASTHCCREIMREVLVFVVGTTRLWFGHKLVHTSTHKAETITHAYCATYSTTSCNTRN